MKSVQIRSFFTSDTGKYGPKKLCIWTLFTYSHSFKKFLKQKLMFLHSKFNRYFTLVIVCESTITTSFLWFGITSFENIHGIISLQEELLVTISPLGIKSKVLRKPPSEAVLRNSCFFFQNNYRETSLRK